MTKLLSKCKLLIFPFFLFCAKSATSQEINLEHVKENIKQAKLLTTSGGINFNTFSYNGSNLANRNPFTWQLIGNVNFRVANLIDLPVTFNFTNLSHQYKLPISPSRIGIHPTYKGFKAHLGDVNMVFSPYTLNAHQFTGAGFDYQPLKSKFNFSLMTGRMQKAVNYEYGNQNIVPAYQRFGYGFRVGFNDKLASVHLNFFSAKDKINSVSTPLDSIGIKPLQNAVGSISAAFRPAKFVELSIESAVSAMTEDLRNSEDKINRSLYLVGNLIHSNNTTTIHNATNAKLKFNIKNAVLGIGYEKIDPGFRTLGAYFFANDLTNYTLLFAKPLFKNKLSINTNFGLQYDNLDNNKANTNSRFVGLFNINFSPNEKFILSANYSNFRTYMRIKSQFLFINQINQLQTLDTFNFTQITDNVNVFVMQQVHKNAKNAQYINANFSFQNAQVIQKTNESGSNKSIFYNFNCAYTYNYLPSNYTVTTSYNLSLNDLNDQSIITQGPILSLDKKSKNKNLGFGTSISYNKSTSSNGIIAATDIYNFRFYFNYLLLKKHNFRLSTGYQNFNHQSNWLINAGYGLRF